MNDSEAQSSHLHLPSPSGNEDHEPTISQLFGLNVPLPVPLQTPFAVSHSKLITLPSTLPKIFPSEFPNVPENSLSFRTSLTLGFLGLTFSLILPVSFER